MVRVECLEVRQLLAAPDLVGFDFRPFNAPTAYFHVEEASPAWGDQIHLDFAYLNKGGNPTTQQTFNIQFYISADSNITTGDYAWQRFTGFTVPNTNNGQAFTATLSLPASDPVSPLASGPYFIGMIVDSDNSVAESDETNNSNQGAANDLTGVPILSPVAVATDSMAPSTDHAINFGAIVNDGTGNAQTTQTVTLSDSAARSLLKVSQNGIHLVNGTNFHIVSILSNKLSQAVNITSGSSLLAANSSETWSIQVAFDPIANGALTDTLQIQTDDPTNPTINIALSGSGTAIPHLVVADSVSPSNDKQVNFGDIGVDGSGGVAGLASVTLTDAGSGPLTIGQNGLSLPAGPFSVTGITSNTQGAIDLATGAKTIAAGGTETWTVNLRFDPTATGLFQVPLTIASNDPDSPVSAVSLLGTGKTVPQLAVTDSVAPTGDLAVSFGNIHADGAGKQLATQTVTLANNGQLPLQVSQNGITLATGAQFKIAGIVSSTQGAIDLSSGAKTLSGANAETWTVTLQFDPLVAGPLADALRIAGNDPANPTTTVSLSGTGLNQPALVVQESDSPNNDLVQTFPPTLDDGTGGRTSTQTIQLKNIGAQPLVVSQNGIRLLGGTDFTVVSIFSSISGAVNLAAASATLAATGSETWIVTLAFDPHSAATSADNLQISSNDPVHPTVNVGLSGLGVLPAIVAGYPSQTIHVSAGSAYHITWNGTYAPGTGTFSVYYDTDRNPAAGLVAIATALPQTKSSFDWQVPTSLVGGTYTLYVTIQDGGVTASSYAGGSLTVDALGSDRILSAPVTDQSTYTLSYFYNGQTYSASYALAMGDNPLYATGGGATHEYHVVRAATLVDSDDTTYDELGNVVSTTDSNGQSISYQYDQLSRVTHIAYADGTTVDYTYDAASNLLTMHDASGWQIYRYDIRDRLTSVTYSPTNNVSDPAALTIGYEYDADSRLTALVYPSGKRVEYGYDNASKLTTVTEKNSGQPDLVTTYAYSPTTGLLTTETRPNDTQTVYGYDTNGQLIDILHRRTSTSAMILQYHYTVDAAGRRTQVVVTTPTGVRAEAYVYDELDRLTQVTYSDDNGTIDPTDRVVKYVYDANGNRLSQTTYANGVAAGATQTLTYVYGFENRLLTVTDQNGVVQESYAYDWRGNQVEKVTPTGTMLYGYDSRNLLVSVDDGTNYIEYQYDGAGRRVGQMVNGVATRFVVDPSNSEYQTIEERSASGGLSADYAYGYERVSGRLPGQSTSTYYLTDALGSTGGLTDSTGASTGLYSYDAYGTPRTTQGGGANSFLFTGERYDSVTSSVYLRHRTYDSQTGTFLEEDASGHPDGPSRYQYAQDNPVNSMDPTGTVTVDERFIPIDAFHPASHAFLVVTDDVNGQQYIYRGGPSPDSNGYGNVIAYAGPYGPGGIDYTSTPRAVEVLINQPGVPATSIINKLDALNDQVNSLKIPYSITGPNSNTYVLDARQVLGVPGTPGISQLMPAFGILAPGFGDLTGNRPNVIATAAQSVLDAAGSVLGSLGDAITPPAYGEGNVQQGNLPFNEVDPGGVLIDQAATLVGSNIKDITGATFDPVTHQLVFLGTSNPATLHDVNLDLFTTAIASVYGSAVPPYVTLDPPAKLVQQNFNLGDGDGVIANGKTAAVLIHYTPYTATEADDMTLTFNVNNTPVTVRLDGYLFNIFAGGRQAMGLTTLSVTGAPAGVSVTMLPKGTIGGGEVLSINSQGQDSYWVVSIANTSGAAQTVTNLQLIPDLQHRKLGGRTDNTQLGWIMEEADRVMKELAGGKDQLTGAIYDSHNPALPPGFLDTLERYVANNQSGSFSNRFWFTPNNETLKQYIDPATGEATIVFDQSSVKLNTEALILGQPEDPTAKAFADYFNAHYDQLAQISFPVHDPSDPTGNTIIQVKIFDELRDAMKAVAVARFFHDNNVPLDTWWINSWTPPVAYIPATIPTLTNSLSNGSLTVNFYGGVSIKTPNTYLPDAVAKAISDAVIAQRTPTTGDLSVPSWTVNTATSAGTLNAVAASLDLQKQDANVTLGAADLTFASPGGGQLAFDRYYNSGYLGDSTLGLGWQATDYAMQFQFPTFVDDAGLMRDSGGSRLAVTGLNSDTQIRSGEVRLVDQASGQLLNFFSSLSTAYSLDGQGNPILAVSGLTANDVPTFTAGQYQDGSTLTQNSSTKNYTLTRTDGSTVVFDPQGNLLTTTNRLGYAINYGYTNGKLSQITDSANQKLTVTYGSGGRIQYVAGPDNNATPQRRIEYKYDSGGRLVEVDTEVLQANSTYKTARATQYQYNASNQISGVVGPDGLTTLTNTPDVRGRSTQRQDVLGNMVANSFTQDSASGDRTTQSTDMGTTGVNDPTAQGDAALKYFAAGSTSTTQFDDTARTTQSVNALGESITYGYTGSSLLPNTLTLPTPNRPSISIQRNAANLPTVIDDPANTGGTPVQITYTAANLPDQVTDSKGLVTKYTYTTLNDIATMTVAFGTPLAATTTYNYNSRKLLQSVVDPVGHTIASYTYDSLDRLQTETDGDNLTTTYQYDSVGRLSRVYDPRLTGTINYIAYTYNDNDQVTQIATPTGNMTYQYDSVTHRLISTTDLAGSTTQYAYDPATGMVTSVTQIAATGNAITGYIYDRRGELAALVAPDGNRTAFRYDALGRPTDVIEDNNTAPAAAAVSGQTTSGTTMTVQVTATEPILAAALTYWQEGQPRSSAQTQSLRLDDQTAFAFALTGLDTAHRYRYELTLTDRVGLSQTLPQGAFGALNAVEGNSTGNVVLSAFTDSDPSAPLSEFTPTVNWGGTLIGTPTVTVQLISRSASASDWQVVGNATYAKPGSYTVTASVAATDGNTILSSQANFNVADAVLTDTTPMQTLNAVEESSTGSVILATFTDANPSAPLSDYTPSVNWGGALVGTPTVAVQLVSRTATVSNWQVVGTATYAEFGSYSVIVNVNDVDGNGAQSSQISFSVTPAPLATPSLTATAASPQIAATLLQKAVQGFSLSSSARQLQYTNNVAAGSLLAAFVAFEAGSGTPTITVSDNVNGAWTQAGGYVRNGVTTGAWFYFINSAGGSHLTVTVTPSAAVYMSVNLHDYSVSSPAGVMLDSTATNTGTGTTIATGTCAVSDGGELVLAGFAQGTSALTSVHVGAPFVLEDNQPNGTIYEGSATADDTNAGSSEGALFTVNTAVPYAAMTISLKLHAIGPPAAVNLAWNNVPRALGFRVYQATSPQSTLLATLGAGATTYQATNLPNASSVGFFVEAFRSSATADSAQANVTLALDTPSLSAAAASPTVANLVWGAVSQALGYRVYQLTGTQSTLLAALGGNATTYQVTGLTPASTVSFVVEAYNGPVVADSSQAGITLPLATPVLTTSTVSQTVAALLLQKMVQGFGLSSSARQLQYTNNVAAGSLLAAFVAFEAGSGTPTITVSDNVNGAWTQAGGYVRNGVTTGAWFYFINSAGGSHVTVTVTPSAAVYMSVDLHEYHVSSPASIALDSTTTNTGSGSTIATGACAVSGNGELVLAGFGQGKSALTSVNVGAPFALENNQPNGTIYEGSATADDTNAGSSVGAVFTVNTAVPFAAMEISFKLRAGVPPAAVNLTWNSVPQAVGYRVYQVGSPQSTLLATLGAGATTYQATSLPNASSVAYFVEAFKGLVTADSAQANVALALDTPSLSATAASPTVANLVWGAVSQALGYRVYQVNGTQSTLLAALGGNATTYQVTGLTPASTVSFSVEAFNGPVVADSSQSDVLLPLATPSLTATAASTTTKLLQKTTQGFGLSNSARQLQYTNNVAAGSLLAAFVAFEAGSGTPTITVSDNVNGAWTQAGGYVRNGVTTGAWFYFINSAGGNHLTVTVTPSAAVYMSVNLHEYFVNSPAGVTLDSTTTNTGSGSTIATGACAVSGNGELVLAGFGQGKSALTSVNVGAPFALENNQPNGTIYEGSATADDTNAGSPVGAVFTVNTAVPFAAMEISFKIPASAPPTAVNLTWGAVPQALGYRVYQVIGTQSTLLATLGALATTYQATGLTPGSTVYYFVEAFNGSVTADSATSIVTLSL